MIRTRRSLRFRGLRAALVPLAPLLLALACGDEEDTTAPDPPGPVAFAIAELRPRGSEIWKLGDSEPVAVGCDANLGVTVVVYNPLRTPGGAPPDPRAPEYLDGDWRGDWLMRPPGACGRPQCGPVRVTVEAANGEAVTAEAAVETVIVDLRPLGDAAEGRLRIHAELHENGRAPATKAGEPLADELEIEATREMPCSPDGEGGAGAGGAPAGGTGGSAGMGGDGTAGSGNQGGQAGAGAPGTGGSAGAPGGTGGAAGAPGGAGGEGGV